MAMVEGAAEAGRAEAERLWAISSTPWQSVGLDAGQAGPAVCDADQADGVGCLDW